MDEASLAAAIDQLHEDMALDDERFAVRYAEDKREISGWGPERIRAALKGRGLDESLIDKALATESRDDQLQRAIEFLVARGPDLEDPDQRRKAAAALARRGFESEISYDALREFERARRDGGGNG